MWIACLHCKEQLDRLDSPGSLLTENAPFSKRLANQTELEMLKVTETAMDQTGRAGAGPPTEILRFHQTNFKATLNRISGDGDTVDATTKDKNVCIATGLHVLLFLRAAGWVKTWTPKVAP